MPETIKSEKQIYLIATQLLQGLRAFLSGALFVFPTSSFSLVVLALLLENVRHGWR
jgi:hypothetical protein